MPSAADNASIFSGISAAPSRFGASRQPQFTLDTFSSQDFIVKDFIEALSDAAIPPNRRTGPQAVAFDPKPLIRTFELALNKLKLLSEDLELQENELSGGVRRAEAIHNQNVQARERELERAVDSFHRLERSLDNDKDQGGNAAVRIGERLDELDRQSQRAQDAKFILQCWIDVSERRDLSSLDDVRRLQGGEGKLRCAHIARQLLKISQRLDAPSSHTNGDAMNGHDTTTELIEKFLESLEKDLLKQFDDFYRRQNFDGMRECAIALKDFGDGASVMGLFVNQHQFFIDRSQLITEDLAADPETWERLADPDTEPPGVEPSLQSLVDEVKLVVQEESFIIKKAFPFHEEVLVRFLQRIFQQSIQQKLEMVLDKADSISSLAFLRSLQASRSYISALVEDLKAHGLTEHPEPASAQTAAVLDQQLEDLFVPYFSGSSYIEREKRSLEELYSSLLFKFTTYHTRRRKMPTSYLGSLSARSRELISSTRDTYLDRLENSDIPASQKSTLLRIAGLNPNASHTHNRNDVDVSEEDGALSLPFIKRMLKWLAESVGRGLELANGHETPKDIRELLGLLIANMGEIYLETALDAITESATTAESSTKNEPDFNHLTSLRSAISILHLLLATIQTLLLPLASTNLTIRRDLDKTTTAFIDRSEQKIDTILQKTIDASLTYSSRLLSQQKKTDFRPRDDALLQLDQLQTPTCLALFTFLTKVHARAETALSGKVLESFLLELALGIRALLLIHFRSYPVSLTGGLIVSKDMAKYIELLKSWKLPQGFKESLEVLTEIANLFVIGPDALRDRVRGLDGVDGVGGGQGQGQGQGQAQGQAGQGAKLEKADLKPYILMREDARSIGVQSVLGL
ncbi:exocyst complex component Sec10 [Aureobasidium pullulans]|uniref:Exocyst complex component Sec10 n=1 Tax=Aureobasidium pullulans TaxID=5580 RepID=A0A4S8V2L5_AURPU|nr:exocyst complex component Sec10 [Aureobasidium pullulans]THY45530.1 exocyst complex component Sec10 [Aureobasidium pullulans]THZ16949.1 exocyst complex component Sec10 [Aureobasidium pullulans]